MHGSHTETCKLRCSKLCKCMTAGTICFVELRHGGTERTRARNELCSLEFLLFYDGSQHEKKLLFDCKLEILPNQVGTLELEKYVNISTTDQVNEWTPSHLHSRSPQVQ